VTLTPRGVERAKTGHLWIYRSDLADVAAEAGDVVQVIGPRGRPVGQAFYSDRSQIALRLVARGTDRGADESLWRERLAAALRFRESLGIDATAYATATTSCSRRSPRRPTGCCRSGRGCWSIS
jgi:23S rRNA (cytosine1962-C5)-methyltransferase